LAGRSDIVRGHQALLEPLVGLPYPRAIVHVERSQGVDLVVQMLSQWLCKLFDQAPHLLPIVVLGLTSSSVLVEPIESRRESFVLLYVAFHDPTDFGDLLYAREEYFFFGIVVVVHGLGPALAVSQEVPDRAQVVAW
jgi:hypothetical protein